MPKSHFVTSLSLWGLALREIQWGDAWVMKPT
jgi:hypothetical protein